MYGLAVTTTPQQFGNHVAVNSVADVEYLIKESEIETGEPGRDFLLRVGEQMLAYRLMFDGTAFAVLGQTPTGLPVNYAMLARELEQSQFGMAMREYRLFCTSLEEGASCCCTTTASTPAQ